MTLPEAMKVLIGIQSMLTMHHATERAFTFRKQNERFFSAVCHEQQKTTGELLFALALQQDQDTDVPLGEQSEKVLREIVAMFIYDTSLN